ncbi:MAG TPA: hypothetical protein ENH62_05845 [Marinobacter sp.]|uniref:HNH nuclease domain-containing protein n=1 Tax=marine sediment metagenome TaxID=412755 RepID=A0A0F9TMG8_9ZZZZ|nr:hypothetical protein [Marinobacter sp.]
MTRTRGAIAQQKWRERHPEKTREYTRLHSRKIADCATRWAKENPEKVAIIQKRRYDKNKDKVTAKNRRRRKAHPEKVTEYANAAKAIRLRAIPLRAFKGQDDAARQKNMDELHARTRSKSMGFSDLTTEAYRESLHKIYGQAALMRKTDGIIYHVDHKVPLGRGGKHHPDNMQILTGLLNQQKGDKMPKEKRQ